MNLYELLGVRVNASQKTIRTAYLRKVKECHPDAGGDPEKFRSVQHAYEVLSDPGRRKLYDETGADGMQRPEENEEARQLGSIVATIMANIVNSNVNIQFTNVIEKTRIELAQKAFQMEADLKMCRQKAKRIENLMGRFLKKDDGPDFIVYSLKEQLLAAQNTEKNILNAQELHRKVVAVFQGYDYRMDPLSGEGQSSGQRATPEAMHIPGFFRIGSGSSD